MRKVIKKYLRSPECFSGSKEKLLAFIGQNLNKRLKGWFAKKCSLGGKEVFLKSIAMALYAMSCFRFKRNHCQKITSVMVSLVGLRRKYIRFPGISCLRGKRWVGLLGYRRFQSRIIG